jgi:hypothetical protein
MLTAESLLGETHVLRRRSAQEHRQPEKNHECQPDVVRTTCITPAGLDCDRVANTSRHSVFDDQPIGRWTARSDLTDSVIFWVQADGSYPLISGSFDNSQHTSKSAWCCGSEIPIQYGSSNSSHLRGSRVGWIPPRDVYGASGSGTSKWAISRTAPQTSHYDRKLEWLASTKKTGLTLLTYMPRPRSSYFDIANQELARTVRPASRVGI